MKIFNAITLFNKTNVKNSIVIAALHWPQSVTWRWSLWYHFELNLIPKIKWHCFNGHGQIVLIIPIGTFSFNWQPNMFRRQANE